MITTVRLPPYQQATMITTVGARRLASASQDNKSSSIQPSRPRSPFQYATMITTVGARRLASASQDNNSSSIQPSRPLSPPEHKTARY